MTKDDTERFFELMATGVTLFHPEVPLSYYLLGFSKGIYTVLSKLKPDLLEDLSGFLNDWYNEQRSLDPEDALTLLRMAQEDIDAHPIHKQSIGSRVQLKQLIGTLTKLIRVN